MAAQNPSLPKNPYPANDSPLTLSSGTVVHQRNLVVFRGRQGSSLTITIQTATPSADSGGVAREAQEVAAMHDTYAQSEGISRITIAVCRSQGCLELREVASEMFYFVRTADGTWTVDLGKAP